MILLFLTMIVISAIGIFSLMIQVIDSWRIYWYHKLRLNAHTELFIHIGIECFLIILIIAIGLFLYIISN